MRPENSQPEERPPKPSVSPEVLVLVFGLLATAWVARKVDRLLVQRLRSEGDQATATIALKLQERLAAYQALLRGGVALFGASREVTRDEWRSYFETLELGSLYRGILGMGFARVLPAGEIPAHEAAIRAEGFPDYRVHPTRPRETWTSIVYLEPFHTRNRRAFGYDMYSESTRRAAMARARDTGRAALSGKVLLLQETETDIQAGTLLYLPVYRNGAALPDISARRRALVGWVYSPYRMNDLMKGILGRSLEDRVRFELFDGDRPAPGALLFRAGGAREPGEQAAAYTAVQGIEVAGRPWTLRVRLTAAAEASYHLRAAPAATGLLGALISILLAGLISSLRQTRWRAREIADRLTARLRDTQLRRDLALEAAAVGIWDWDAKEDLVYLDARAAELLGGGTPGRGAPPSERERHIIPEDRARARAAWRDHVSGASSRYRCEYRVDAGPENPRWVLDMGRVVARDAAGEPTRSAGSVLDVTEQRRAEYALRRRNAALDAAANAIVITDRDGRVTWANARYHEVIGVSATDVIGRPLWRLEGREDLAPHDGSKWARLLAGEVVRGERERQTPAGEALAEHETITPVSQEDGRVASVVFVREDITNQLELRRQVLRSQRIESVGRLAGGIAHDFNNLLTVIRGGTRLLLDDLPAAAAAREDLELIESAAARGAALTRQLLAFGRKQSTRPRPLDLGREIRRLEPLLRKTVPTTVALRLGLSPDLWPVLADPGQVEQVLLNLVINARDAMGARPGTLSIETKNVTLDDTYLALHHETYGGDHVMVAVTDTGCGMDAETLDRAFEPFYSTKPEGEGSGLGLASVFGIVKQSKGNTWIYSEPGRGTTVKIYLPRHLEGPEVPPSPAPTTAPPSSDAPASRGARVLLVEDDPDLRLLTARVLARAGFRAEVAASPRAAIRMIEGAAEPFRLLLTDVVMPEMDGFALAAELTERYPDLRVLFMSGYTRDTVTRRGGLPARREFIEKPFLPRDLLGKIRGLLDPDPAGGS